MRKSAVCHCDLSRTRDFKKTPRENEILQLPTPTTSTGPKPVQSSAFLFRPRHTPDDLRVREPSCASSFPTSVLSKLSDPPLAPEVASGSRPGRTTNRRRLGGPSRRSSPPARPTPAPAQLPPPAVPLPPNGPRPRSHLSTHSRRKRISSVCRTLGSCLHIFTKARSSLTLRGSMVQRQWQAAGEAEVATRFQARVLAQRDRVEGGFPHIFNGRRSKGNQRKPDHFICWEI